MLIGEIDVQRVIDGEGRLNPKDLFFPPARGWFGFDLAAHPDFFTPDGGWQLPIGANLVRTGDAVVLVDAGVGPAGQGALGGGYLLEDLRAFGVAPEDVTDVLFTHLHDDHTGWAFVDGAPTFPNATYRCHAADWRAYVEDDAPQFAGDARSFRPHAGRFTLFDADGPVLPGIAAVHAPGHTPGSTMFEIAHGPARCLLLGDVAHLPFELMEPGWICGVDSDRAAAIASRARLAERLAREELLICGAHFSGSGFGYVRDAGRRPRWEFADLVAA